MKRTQTTKGLVMAAPQKSSLTTQEMENNGIKTSLSQNDIVDIIVEEKLNKIMVQLNSLQDDGKNNFKKFLDCIRPQIESFLKEIGHLSEENIKSVQLSCVQYNGCMDTLRFSGDDNICVNMSSVNVYKEGISKLQFSVGDNIQKEDAKTKIEIKSSSSTTWYQPITVTKKQLKPYLTFVEDYKVKLEEFMKTIPTDGRNGRINVVKITREIKNKINKKILKDQAPMIMGQIEKLLDITL